MTKKPLKSETILPDDKEHWLSLRTKDVTSTEVAVLFGLSPYCTRFELFHRKKDAQILNIEANDRMKWGSRLEASIAKGIAEDENWEIRPMKEYMRIPDLRMGASFDYAIGDDAILEVKNVDSLAFKDGWLVEGEDIQAPAHIELQVAAQLAVSGRKRAYIGALIGGNKVILIERVPDQGVIDQIKTKVKEFWKSIDEDRCPEPDFIRDAEFISSLYQNTNPGMVMNAVDNLAIKNLAFKYKDFGFQMMKAKEERDAIKAQLLMLVGPAEKVLGDGFNISAKLIQGGPVSYVRESYRDWRITWKKEQA